jgi:hypothetical protein
MFTVMKRDSIITVFQFLGFYLRALSQNITTFIFVLSQTFLSLTTNNKKKIIKIDNVKMMLTDSSWN